MSSALTVQLRREVEETMKVLGLAVDSVIVTYLEGDEAVEVAVRRGKRLIAEKLPFRAACIAESRSQAISVMAFGLVNGEIQDRTYSKAIAA